MWKYLIVLSILLITSNDIAFGKSWRLLEAKELDFEYLKLRPENRDPYAPQYTDKWKEQIALRWNLGVLRYGYWNNRIHTETVQPSGSVKGVGWQYEVGVHLGKYADLFHAHHSRHIMEESPEDRFENSQNQFPVEDAYGIRIRILEWGK